MRVYVLAVLLAGFASCDDFNPPPWKDGGGSDAGDAAVDLPMDLPDGAECVKSEQCQSGACVDEVCCEGRCTSCALQSKRGKCELVPSGADPRGDCAGDDADCNGSCDGSGCCRAAEPTGCGGYLCDAAGGACKASCTLSTESDDCDAPLAGEGWGEGEAPALPLARERERWAEGKVAPIGCSKDALS
jgi:hypothetical protein